MVEFRYKRFDKSVVTLEQMRQRAIINTLASNKTTKKASKILGISEISIRRFMFDNNISPEDLKAMRKDYKTKIKNYGSNIKNFDTKKK